MIDPDVALSYLDFVAERHRVWERRRNEPGPWTDDPIIQSYKFTNVFRVLDYGSQFLISELLEPDLPPRDTLARCFLYRYTNLPETWTWIRDRLGHYPLADDLNMGLVDIIHEKRDAGEQYTTDAYRMPFQYKYNQQVFSGAYVILPQPGTSGDKVSQAVELTAHFVHEYMDAFLAAGDQAERFNVLQTSYGVGKFLSMQILTDWGYSQYGTDAEDEFIVPGPGCIKGAKFIDPDAKPTDTLEWAIWTVRKLPDCPVLATKDGVRVPSWMDVQNTLCEFSKYHRYALAGTGRVPYVPAHPGPQPDPQLPAHW